MSLQITRRFFWPSLPIKLGNDLIKHHVCRPKSTAAAQNIFDYDVKQAQRRRAALSALKPHKDGSKSIETFDYIKNEVGWRLADRVFDVKRNFTFGLEIAAGRGHVSRHLDDDAVDFLISADPVSELLQQRTSSKEFNSNHQQNLIADDRTLRFLKSSSLDLVVSCLSMHWVNDLHTAFRDCIRVLRPDGVFMGAMFCSDTLFELRSSLQQAENEVRNSFTARVSPFVRPEDVASLLNLAGYNLVTLDCDEFRVGYPSAMELMRDLHGMAEQNCAVGRRLNLTRSIIKRACEIYREMYSESSDGSIPATFQVVYWIGWRPDPSQPAPVSRGSGTFSIKDIGKLVTDEIPTQPVK